MNPQSRESQPKNIRQPQWAASNLNISSAAKDGTDNGGSVSSTAIRALIKQLVEEENPLKPLSGKQIVDLLAQKSFVVAIKTIAKYRESLRIPAVHLRRK